MTKTIRQFLKNESGATAIEYGLIAAVLGALIVAGVTTLGEGLQTTFTNISTKLTTTSGGM